MADVVFVHGAWLGPRSWDAFRGRYEREGLRCVAPPWPLEDRPYDALRETPDPGLARVGVTELVDHYARIVAALPEPPLLVGHSFGGLIVQLLLDRGLGRGGVAIHSAPPRGIFPTPSAVRASLPVLTTWRGWSKVLRMRFEDFRFGFVHALSPGEQRAAFEEHVIPTPGRPFFQVAFAPFSSTTRVSFAKPDRAPLLLLAGAADRTVPAAMNRANHRAYRRGAAVAFRELPGRSHWVIAEPGWEEVADIALGWAREQGCVRQGAAAPARGDGGSASTSASAR